MSKKEFMGQVFISFFVVVTCINLGMADVYKRQGLCWARKSALRTENTR